MKTNALLAFFFFALFAFSKAAYVRDSQGHLITNGGTYYIKPQGFANSVIGDTNITNPVGTCSLAVVEKFGSGAIPVRIISPIGGADISTEKPIEISFYDLPSNPCTEIPSWLVNADEDFEEEAVMVGDPSTFSSPISGSFFITAIDSKKHIYGFRFCTDLRYTNCHDIAIKKDSYENRRLIFKVENETEVESLEFKLVKTKSLLFMVV